MARAPGRTSTYGSRLFLVSCVKTKGAVPASAMDFYTSNWFRKARTCVEKTGCPWRILSAQYGLVHPEKEIGPYEKTLKTMRGEERRAWADCVLAALVPCLDGVDTVVFLAAQRYRQFLEPELHERGLAVRVPGAAAAPGEAAAGTVGRGPGRAPRPGRPNTRPVELPRGFGRD